MMGAWRQSFGIGAVVFVSLGFVVYAASFGLRGLSGDLSSESYLFQGSGAADVSIAAHMIVGAVITLAAPLQLSRPVRHRFPVLHRIVGRMVVGGAFITAVLGVAYIAQRGTIGGPWMNFGFTLYAVCMAVAAVETMRHARARRMLRHQAWALRLFVLVMASFLFRIHYGLWFAATDGLGSNASLTGPFDRVQVLAFFLPYLVILEISLRCQWLTLGHSSARHSQ